jgi:acyl-CoA thioesterase-1
MIKYLLIPLMTLLVAGCSISTTPTTSPTITETPVANTRIFVLWDSLTAWFQLAYEDSYPAQLERKLRSAGYNISVINGGESWDTSEWLKSRIDRITADAQSGDIALVVIGGNDGLRGLPVTDLEKNISEIIWALQARGITTIVGGMQIPTNLGETYRTAFADIYPRVADKTNSLLIPFILSGVAGIPELNLRDGIHPNAEWQAIIAETVFELILNNIELIIN